MSRRELREQIFKLLFRVEFNGREEMPEQEQLFFEQFSYEDEEILVKDSDARYISEKSSKIIDRLEEIDEMINKQAKGWTTQRMVYGFHIPVPTERRCTVQLRHHRSL